LNVGEEVIVEVEKVPDGGDMEGVLEVEPEVFVDELKTLHFVYLEDAYSSSLSTSHFPFTSHATSFQPKLVPP